MQNQESAQLEYVQISKLIPSLMNPRKQVGDITGLSASIVAQGLVQPLRARPVKGGSKLELVAGARRFAAISAAIAAGNLPEDYKIPVLVEPLDDPTAVCMMYVENLMRENLSDYEQAESFQNFIDFNAEADAVSDLAARTGLSEQYIRRRVRVMALPAPIKNLWKEGKLSYGHMEQFLRMDPSEAIKMAQNAAEYNQPVSVIKAKIDSSKAVLANAAFDTQSAMCHACRFSSSVQGSLFGAGFGTDKDRCLKPECYFEKQTAALHEKWQKLPVVKQNGTNGIVINDQWSATTPIAGATAVKCITCPDYVSQLYPDGSVFREKGCKGNKFCFSGTYEHKNIAAKQAMSMISKQKQKVNTIGRESVESFYREQLPEKLGQTRLGDARIDRIIASAVVSAFPGQARSALSSMPAHEAKSQDFKTAVLNMNKEDIAEFYQQISKQLLFDSGVFDLQSRRSMAEQFGTNVERDFKVNMEFLKRQTKDQLIEMVSIYKILKSHSAQELAAMKKTDIISLILAQDLTGIVPDEILAAISNEDLSTKSPPPCEVCGEFCGGECDEMNAEYDNMPA